MYIHCCTTTSHCIYLLEALVSSEEGVLVDGVSSGSVTKLSPTLFTLWELLEGNISDILQQE